MNELEAKEILQRVAISLQGLAKNREGVVMATVKIVSKKPERCPVCGKGAHYIIPLAEDVETKATWVCAGCDTQFKIGEEET